MLRFLVSIESSGCSEWCEVVSINDMDHNRNVGSGDVAMNRQIQAAVKFGDS